MTVVETLNLKAGTLGRILSICFCCFMEIWKPVPGYESLYEVSSHGQVRNKLNRILSQKNKKGYKRVELNSNRTSKQKFVHRLVAMAFIPNPDGKPQVNHKNGIKHDNRIENLEWNTPKENVRHAIEILGKRIGVRTLPEKSRNHPNWARGGEMKGRTGANHPKSKSIASYDLNGNLLQIHSSSIEAAAAHNTIHQNVYAVASGRRKQHKGVVYKYFERTNV